MKVAALTICLLLACCQSFDIENDLVEAVEALNSLIFTRDDSGKLLQTLTSIDDWGMRVAISSARAVFALTNEQLEWGEGEMGTSISEKHEKLTETRNTLEKKLDQIKERMSLKDLPIQLGPLELDITTIDDQIDLMILASMQNKNMITQLHINNLFMLYQQNYKEASEKLYEAMTSKTNNMFQLVKEKLRNHKKNTFDFVIATTIMMLHSISIDTTYRLLKEAKFEDGMESDNVNEILEDIYEMWLPRLTELGQEISQLNDQLTEAWEEQYPLDVSLFLQTQQETSSYSIAENLHKELSEKFPWRNWFVVVTEAFNHPNLIDINTCGGLAIMNHNGKHVFVSSGDVDESFDRQLAIRHLNSVSDKFTFHVLKYNKAQLINEKVNAQCSDFRMFGTFGQDGDAMVSGRSIRFTAKTQEVLFKHTWYTSFIMG